MREQKAFVHIIVDEQGVDSIQIVGPSESHSQAHDLYFLIRDLVMEFDKGIRERLRYQNHDEEYNG